MAPNFCDNRRSDYCKLILSLEFVVLYVRTCISATESECAREREGGRGEGGSCGGREVKRK